MKNWIIAICLVGVCVSKSRAGNLSNQYVKNCQIDYRTAPSTNNKSRVALVLTGATASNVVDYTYYYLFDSNNSLEVQKANAMLAVLMGAYSTNAPISIIFDAYTWDNTPRKVLVSVELGQEF